MKFSIGAAAFADAAAWAIRAVSARPQAPVLVGVLIETSADTIRVSGFDYEKTAHAVTPADIERQGRAVIPGRLLVDILGKLQKKGTVTLEVHGSKATLTTGKSKFNLALIPHGHYPELPATPPKVATIDGSALAEAIGRVKVAAGRDPALPILAGIHLADGGGQLLLQATDRYRMTEATVPWQANGEPVDWLVPTHVLEDVVRMAAGDLDIHASESGVTFVSGNRSMGSVLTAGDYPRIGGLFPTNSPIDVVVERDALLEAANLTATVAERNTPVRLTMSPEEIQLDAGTGEDAQGVEYIPAVMTGAKDYVLGFNPWYLAEAVRAFPAGDIRFLLSENNAKPALLVPGDETVEYRHLLMPVRLGK